MGTLARLQEIELDVFNEVRGICEQHDLRCYTLGAGVMDGRIFTGDTQEDKFKQYTFGVVLGCVDGCLVGLAIIP